LVVMGGGGDLEEVADDDWVRYHHEGLWTKGQLVNPAALYEPEPQSKC
jgi:hypothetical protein